MQKYSSQWSNPVFPAVETHFLKYLWRNSPTEPGGDSATRREITFREITFRERRGYNHHEKKIPGISARSWKDILIPATATNWTTALRWLPSLRSSSFAVTRLGAVELSRHLGHSAAGYTFGKRVRFYILRTELTLPSRQEEAVAVVFGVLLKDTFPGTKTSERCHPVVPIHAVYTGYMVWCFVGWTSSSIGQNYIWLQSKSCQHTLHITVVSTAVKLP